MQTLFFTVNIGDRERRIYKVQKGTIVAVLTFPSFEVLPDVDVEECEIVGMCLEQTVDPYAGSVCFSWTGLAAYLCDERTTATCLHEWSRADPPVLLVRLSSGIIVERALVFMRYEETPSCLAHHLASQTQTTPPPAPVLCPVEEDLDSDVGDILLTRVLASL